MHQPPLYCTLLFVNYFTAVCAFAIALRVLKSLVCNTQTALGALFCAGTESEPELVSQCPKSPAKALHKNKDAGRDLWRARKL
jgi:hypothetical protein